VHFTLFQLCVPVDDKCFWPLYPFTFELVSIYCVTTASNTYSNHITQHFTYAGVPRLSGKCRGISQCPERVCLVTLNHPTANHAMSLTLTLTLGLVTLNHATVNQRHIQGIESACAKHSWPLSVKWDFSVISVLLCNFHILDKNRPIVA